MDIENDRQLVISESEQLVKGIAMVKDVIVAQQSFAKGVFLTEEVQLERVLEDVLSMQLPTLARHQIRVVKRLGKTSQVKAQKAKLAHIVLNLLKNAREAMLAVPEDKRILTVETGGEAETGFFIRVTDTGEGIPDEIRRKIFSHGFTTKESGHGFGLHYCANAMVEMGGKLILQSEGRGKGASFTLMFRAESMVTPVSGSECCGGLTLTVIARTEGPKQSDTEIGGKIIHGAQSSNSHR